MNKSQVELNWWDINLIERQPPWMTLRGHGTGHPRLGTGWIAYTSNIINLDVDRAIVETSNTIYQLKDPSTIVEEIMDKLDLSVQEFLSKYKRALDNSYSADAIESIVATRQEIADRLPKISDKDLEILSNSIV